MKIENVYVRSIVVGLIGAAFFLVVCMLFGYKFNFLWKIAFVFFVLKALDIIVTSYFKRFRSS
jgi:hypothetical protein